MTCRGDRQLMIDWWIAFALAILPVTSLATESESEQKSESAETVPESASTPAEIPGLTRAEEVETRAELLPPEGKIKKLKWKKNDDLEVLAHDGAGGAGSGFKVTLRGSYSRKDWTLLWNSMPVELSEKGDFEFAFPISGEMNEGKLVAIGPMGKTEKVKLKVRFPSWEDFLARAGASPPKRIFITPGLGLSLISYSETGIAPFSQIAITGKISYAHLVLPPRWDFAANAYMTLLPVSSSQEISARFFGASMRIGYVLPSVKAPWRVSLLAGAYYATTFVQGDGFGYKNVSGPQIFPTVRRELPGGDSVLAYFKFSPISAGFSFLQLSNHELAAGLIYSRPLPDGRTASITLDAATLGLSLAGIRVRSTSVSLGVAYGL